MHKISQDIIQQREDLRHTQTAEQLVEVPTILHFFKQTVDIPVPRVCGRRCGDLQGFHTGQGSTALLGAEQTVDVPVPRVRGHRLQGFPLSTESNSAVFRADR